MTWKAWVAAPGLVDRRELGSDLLSFNGIARHLAGGEWEAKVVPSVWAVVEPWMPLEADMAAPVFAVMDGPRVLMAGPVRTSRYERSGADTTVTLAGVDDYAAVLGSRLVWPEPANLPPWPTSAYHTIVGQASAVVVEFIRRHRGDLARVERRGTPLNVTDRGAGPVGTWRYRLTPLIDAVAQVGREAALSVTVTRRLASNDIAVTVGGVQNRTGVVLDDSKLGDSTLSLTAATSTTVVSGGTGEGVARLFAIVGSDVAGDVRVEAFSDQRSIDTQLSLDRSAAATRAAAAATSSFGGAITPAAAAQYQWHTHYELGDTVTLRVSRSSWPVTVEAVTLTWDATGQRALPVLGTTPRHALAQLLLDVEGLADRLNNLDVV